MVGEYKVLNELIRHTIPSERPSNPKGQPYLPIKGNLFPLFSLPVSFILIFFPFQESFLPTSPSILCKTPFVPWPTTPKSPPTPPEMPHVRDRPIGPERGTSGSSCCFFRGELFVGREDSFSPISSPRVFHSNKQVVVVSDPSNNGNVPQGFVVFPLLTPVVWMWRRLRVFPASVITYSNDDVTGVSGEGNMKVETVQLEKGGRQERRKELQETLGCEGY
ncbi:hypothetical protein LIER_39544 [Lithospermum erythrorhizon]|uniref:Uncharacterized protein n=1 Tax=Lithospermum erythrorhizon TaxID=34254 RepID=A0AAV3QJ45_LITER